jgi:hypothetical protein
MNLPLVHWENRVLLAEPLEIIPPTNAPGTYANHSCNFWRFEDKSPGWQAIKTYISDLRIKIYSFRNFGRYGSK